ncbi:MAG: glutamate--tRNA ligase, partial [Methanobrevibacter sp.]|nr:glutamate--tRNA ligase [Methanobrevibacter sp.]
QHKGNANPKAVMGSIMSNEVELRKEAKKIGPIANDIVSSINQMSQDDIKKEIAKLGIELESKKEEKEKGLANLPGSQENVVMRFAPNPSGPLHIGHARAAVPNGEYCKRYNGKLILRIEDTDPKRIYPPAYDMILEDLKWLEVAIDEVHFQSDRFPIYYDYCEKLIELGAAYMCTCDGGEFKKLKDEKKPCPCRDNTVKENIKLWEEFPSMESGQAVLRIKTDIQHKNPAIRDWVAMRIIDEEHPRMGTRYRIYPMMNFSVAIDDHLMGLTHVLRGKDHLANSEKQKYIYQHLNWEVPEFIHYGRLKMEDIPLSTSKALAGIKDGTYSGWDDSRLGTLRAIAKRGIQSKAIYDLILEIGVKMADSAISWKKIYGLNRNILEKKANRYFFVSNERKLKIANLDEKEIAIPETILRPLHPDFLDRGNRKLVFDGEVYVSSDDVSDGMTRLMDAVNIDIKGDIATFIGKSFEDAREKKMRIIQWVPANDNIKAKIVMDDASVIDGLCEANCKNLKKGDIVQFERFGFVRLDEIANDELIFYFAHK